MSLPKTLDRIEEKVDRLLALKAPAAQPSAELRSKPKLALAEPPRLPVKLDPNQVAASLDYDTYNAKEVVARVASLSPAERAALLAYEQTHANRKTVLEALTP